MSSGFDKTTNALSVYNAISFAKRPLSPEQIVETLRAKWNAGFDEQDLLEAMPELFALGAVRSDGIRVDVIKRSMSTGRGPRLARHRPGEPLFFAEGAL